MKLPGSVWAIAGLVGLSGLAQGTPNYPDCADGLTCGTVTPAGEGLSFDCAWVAAASNTTEKGQVYCMHGNDGRNAKGMFFSTMLQLSANGYSALACDARGYSPDASPYKFASYNYDDLVDDIVSITDEQGFKNKFGGKFHIVAHDQGARVSWHSIAKNVTRPRLLSFTSLSIPHADVFSDLLYGNRTNEKALLAAQYWRMLMLPDSAQVDGGRIMQTACVPDNWNTTEECQRVLWWYNGGVDAGAVALPAWNTSAPYGPIAKYIGINGSVVVNLTQYPMQGVPQTVKVRCICCQLERWPNFTVFVNSKRF